MDVFPILIAVAYCAKLDKVYVAYVMNMAAIATHIKCHHSSSVFSVREGRTAHMDKTFPEPETVRLMLFSGALTHAIHMLAKMVESIVDAHWTSYVNFLNGARTMNFVKNVLTMLAT